MKKKMVSALLCVSMIGSLLAGCGSSSSTDSSADSSEATESTDETTEGAAEETADGDKTTLTITYPDSGDTGENGYMYSWITNTYNSWDKKDSVELDIQPVVANDSDYFTKVQTQMQDASTSPDLFFEDTFQLNTDVAAGYVSDLSSDVEGWEAWNSEFIEALKEGTKGSDGNTYAVPVSTDVRGLWYNKDVFEQAGLGRDWQPETWQDILDACEAIKTNCADDVVPIWFACSNTEAEATSMNTFEMLLYGTGETLVDEETGVWNVSGQGITDSLSFIQTCKENGYIGTLSEVFDASDWEYANKYMSTGKLGMYLNGSWGYADYLSTGSYPMEGYTDDTLSDALGFAQMPKQNGDGYVTMSGGWSWAIANNSDSHDLAFEFLCELMNSDNYITYLVGSGNLATKTGMDSYDEYKNKLYVEEATAMSETAFFRPHNENYSKVSSYIYEMVDTIVRNDTAIEDALSDFTTSVKTAVGEENAQ
ncbi:MAG: extracellular solute-binding protein [Lachnospiraceae bacterium]|nr:extracellular solute-binding protein [Lachnospiraceae bacterium]